MADANSTPKFKVILNPRKDVNGIAGKPVELVEIVGERVTYRPSTGAAKVDGKVKDIVAFVGELNPSEGIMVAADEAAEQELSDSAKESVVAETEAPTATETATETATKTGKSGKVSAE